MRLGTRVWSLGKLLVLTGALGATFLLFFGISVRVGLRAQDVDVPAVVGRTVDQATAMLQALGLTVRIDDTRRFDEKVPADHVMLQDPPAGTRTRRERMVRIWVSSGPRTTTVPSLSGQTERTAQIRLQQEGLQVAAVSEFRSADYDADAVVAQDPPPAGRAPGVSLLLNRAEPALTYVMPDLVGMEAGRTAGALLSHGFRVTIVDAAASPGVELGTIVRQRPAAGFPVSAADAISLEVSR
jgi:eukaryotic-like serine/threonine-protein kinase